MQSDVTMLGTITLVDFVFLEKKRGNRFNLLLGICRSYRLGGTYELRFDSFHWRDPTVQPALDTLSPRYFVAKSVEEIADWLHSQRARTADPLNEVEDYSALRRQFGQLTHRWHPLLTNPQIKQPELAPVHQLAVRALGVSKLIYRELENQRQGQSQLAPELILAHLLALNEHLLDRVSAQLELVESTIYYAEELHEATIKLVTGQAVSPVWLLSLTRRIELEMRPQPEIWQWMPSPGLHLADFIEPRSWRCEAEVYATSLETARLTAWLASHLPQFAERTELLILAALLEDIGFLRLERQTQKTPAELEVRSQPDYRKHPSLGAALAAGVSEYSIELSFLIAQHHERLDGTGYPHGLTRYKLGKDAQLLACLVRFQELASRQPAELMSVEAACYQAAFQLFLESAQGAWSTSATLDLVEALDEELPKALENALATGQPFVSETFLEKRWTCHAADAGVPAPHFLFSRSKSIAQYVGTTVESDRKRSFRRDPKG